MKTSIYNRQRIDRASFGILDYRPTPPKLVLFRGRNPAVQCGEIETEGAAMYKGLPLVIVIREKAWETLQALTSTFSRRAKIMGGVRALRFSATVTAGGCVECMGVEWDRVACTSAGRSFPARTMRFWLLNPSEHQLIRRLPDGTAWRGSV